MSSDNRLSSGFLSAEECVQISKKDHVDVCN